MITQLIALFGAGGASFLAPCIVPLLPAYLGIIVGEAADAQDPARAVPATVVFVLGFSTVFAALGAAAGSPGRWSGWRASCPSRAACCWRREPTATSRRPWPDSPRPSAASDARGLSWSAGGELGGGDPLDVVVHDDARGLADVPAD